MKRKLTLFLAPSHSFQLLPFLILWNDPQNILCTRLLELCVTIIYFLSSLAENKLHQVLRSINTLVATRESYIYAN